MPIRKLKNISFITLGNIDSLYEIKPSSLPIFSKVAKEFLSELSKELFNTENLREYPDIASFAFWCRKSNLESISKNYCKCQNTVGRGLIFHITPTNVPVNFAFSFAFGLLSGSSNIVRIPSKNFPQVEIIINLISKILNQKEFFKLSRTNKFITYERNSEITELISKIVNARLIWGGDETIKSIKKLFSSPRCIDLCFSDRYSFCILNADSFLDLKNKEKNLLIKNFYNDTFVLNQNACSSPHLIIWEGNLEKCNKAKTIFWQGVISTIHKGKLIEQSEIMDKFRHLCITSIEFQNDMDINWENNMIYRINIENLTDSIYRYKFRSGFFFEYSTNNLDDIWKIVNERYQTCTYFGVDPVRLYNYILKFDVLGIDRIVPVGKALDMGHIWDGFDIVKILSRKIILDNNGFNY